MQQQINTESSNLNLTHVHHCSNRQPDLMDQIEADILQSLEQMTGHPISLSNQAPINFNMMIKALECSTTAMAIHTAPYPLAITTMNTQHKQQTSSDSPTPSTDDPRAHQKMAHNQPPHNSAQCILNSPHTSNAHPNYFPCRNHHPQVHSLNMHARTKTGQITTTSCKRQSRMLLHDQLPIPQASTAGYVFHHLLLPSNGRDASNQSTRLDIRHALQPLKDHITIFLHTANTHATALLSQLQHLVSLLTTIYTIIVPSTQTPVGMLNKSTVTMHQYRPMKLTAPEYTPNTTITTDAASGMQNPLLPCDLQQSSLISITQ